MDNLESCPSKFLTLEFGYNLFDVSWSLKLPSLYTTVSSVGLRNRFAKPTKPSNPNQPQLEGRSRLCVLTVL